jgi:hypothetical protein
MEQATELDEHKRGRGGGRRPEHHLQKVSAARG